jgi:hypothetical protein
LVLFVVGLIWSCCWLKLVGDTKFEGEKKNSHYVTQKKKVLGGLLATPWVAGVAVSHLTWLTRRKTEVGGFSDGSNTSRVVASPDFGLHFFFF